MTLREAAERTSRSVTTLRRYIRSGRLHAEKRYGRFGPEYFVSADDLTDAGFDLDEPGDDVRGRTGDGSESTGSLVPRTDGGTTAIAGQVLESAVPRSLFETLQMKHEQLLVQYGMVRAGGLRSMELGQRVEELTRQLEEAGDDRSRLADRLLRKEAELRQARLDRESVQLELDAAREKLRALEMLTRNSATSASIEQQFSSVMEQARKVRDLQESPAEPGTPAPPAHEPEYRHDMTARLRPSRPETDPDH